MPDGLGASVAAAEAAGRAAAGADGPAAGVSAKLVQQGEQRRQETALQEQETGENAQALREVVDSARAGHAAETHGPAVLWRGVLAQVELGPAWALAVGLCQE